MKDKNMEDKKKALAALFNQQKTLYKSLEEKATALVEGIKGEAPMETLGRIMEERSTIVDKLNAGDGKIRETLSGADSESLLENEEIKRLKNELESLLGSVMRTDENAIRLLNEAFAEAQTDLSAISAGHKTVSAYGRQSKPVFAKFFDRRF